MQTDLTIIYEDADLPGATSGVLYLPILRDSTLKSVDVLTDEATTGDAVFEVTKNGVVLDGLDALTIASGDKIGTVSGLDVDLIKGDEIVLNLLSGDVSAPVTLNLTIDDGQGSAGGGGIGGNVYSIDAQPADLNDESDYFPVGTLDSKWTLFQESGFDLLLDDGTAKLAIPAATGYKGFFQSLPGGDCVIITKLIAPVAANYQGIGIGLFSDAGDNPNTSDILVFSVSYNGTNRFVSLDKWTDYQNYGTFYTNANSGNNGRLYLKAKRVGAVWTFSYSSDGYDWTDLTTLNESAFYSPAEFGIVGINTASGTIKLRSEFVFYSSNPNDELPGGALCGSNEGSSGGASGSITTFRTVSTQNDTLLETDNGKFILFTHVDGATLEIPENLRANLDSDKTFAVGVIAKGGRILINGADGITTVFYPANHQVISAGGAATLISLQDNYFLVQGATGEDMGV